MSRMRRESHRHGMDIDWAVCEICEMIVVDLLAIKEFHSCLLGDVSSVGCAINSGALHSF